MKESYCRASNVGDGGVTLAVVNLVLYLVVVGLIALVLFVNQCTIGVEVDGRLDISFLLHCGV